MTFRLPCTLPAGAGGDELINAGFGAVPPDDTPGELVKVLPMMLNARPEWEGIGKGARTAAQRCSTESVTNTDELVYRRPGRRNFVQAKVVGAT